MTSRAGASKLQVCRCSKCCRMQAAAEDRWLLESWLRLRPNAEGCGGRNEAVSNPIWHCVRSCCLPAAAVIPLLLWYCHAQQNSRRSLDSLGRKGGNVGFPRPLLLSPRLTSSNVTSSPPPNLTSAAASAPILVRLGRCPHVLPCCANNARYQSWLSNAIFTPHNNTKTYW